jgi:hypothetical protein
MRLNFHDPFINSYITGLLQNADDFRWYLCFDIFYSFFFFDAAYISSFIEKSNTQWKIA